MNFFSVALVYFLICNWTKEAISSSKPSNSEGEIFGNFDENNDEIIDEKIEKFTDAEIKLYNQFFKVESDSLLGVVPTSLKVYLERDNLILGSHSNLCPNTLYSCAKFLNLGPDKHKRTKKTDFLNLLTQILLEYPSTSSDSSGYLKIRNSLASPICTDALNYCGDAFNIEQLNVFTTHVGDLLFNNVELMSQLENFSFLDFRMLKEKFIKSDSFRVINFLKLPAFLKTADASIINFLIGETFDEELKADIYCEYSDLKKFIPKDRFYSDYFFIYELSGKNIPDSYYNYIIAVIEREGLTRTHLANLIAYVQDTNENIANIMKTITNAWAVYLVNMSSPWVMFTYYSCFYKKKFNELLILNFELLHKLCVEREILKTFMTRFMDSPSFSYFSEIKNFKVHLKKILETPFDSLVRFSYKSRFDFNLYDHIDNTLNLNTQLFFCEAEMSLYNTINIGIIGNSNQLNEMLDNEDNQNIILNYEKSQKNLSSLWRSVFFVGSELILQNNISCDVEAMKRVNSVIYEDNNVSADNLLNSWKIISVVLPRTFRSGNRLFRLIESLSNFPALNNINDYSTSERKNLDKSILSILNELPSSGPELSLVENVNNHWPDFPHVKRALMRHVKRLQSVRTASNHPWLRKGDIVNDLKKVCKVANNMLVSKPDEQTISNSADYFRHLEKVSNSFLLLGPKLSDNQIVKISENEDIMNLLNNYGRALSSSQISGLLNSQIGIIFLKENKRILTRLRDYSAFTSAHFELLNLRIEEIQINAFSLNNEVKMAQLLKEGFNNINNPLETTFSIGSSFWRQSKAKIVNIDSFYEWEMVNIAVLAYGFKNQQLLLFDQHRFGTKFKLNLFKNDEIVPVVILCYLTKCLIFYHWQGFIYRSIKYRYENNSSKFVERLEEIFNKYEEVEKNAKDEFESNMSNFIRNLTAKKDNAQTNNINLLNFVMQLFQNISSLPFHSLCQESTRKIGRKKFNNAEILSKIINKYFSNEKQIWAARLKVLKNIDIFSNKKKVYEIWKTFGVFDKTILKIAFTNHLLKATTERKVFASIKKITTTIVSVKKRKITIDDDLSETNYFIKMNPFLNEIEPTPRIDGIEIETVKSIPNPILKSSSLKIISKVNEKATNLLKNLVFGAKEKNENVHCINPIEIRSKLKIGQFFPEECQKICEINSYLEATKSELKGETSIQEMQILEMTDLNEISSKTDTNVILETVAAIGKELIELQESPEDKIKMPSPSIAQEIVPLVNCNCEEEGQNLLGTIHEINSTNPVSEQIDSVASTNSDNETVALDENSETDVTDEKNYFAVTVTDTNNVDVTLDKINIATSLDKNSVAKALDKNSVATALDKESVDVTPVGISYSNQLPIIKAEYDYNFKTLQEFNNQLDKLVAENKSISEHTKDRLLSGHYSSSLSVSDVSLPVLGSCLDLLGSLWTGSDVKAKGLKFSKTMLLHRLIGRIIDEYNLHNASNDNVKLSSFHTSMSNPVCSVAFEVCGDVFDDNHLNWFLQHFPTLLFNNVELILQISNFSCIDVESVENYLLKSLSMEFIDFLKLPAFLKTAQASVLAIFLRNYFVPVLHLKFFDDFRNFKTLIPELLALNDVRNYSFLAGISGNNIDYVLDSDALIQSIQVNGLNVDNLANLLVFSQEIYDIISQQIYEISEKWDPKKSISKDHLKIFNSKFPAELKILFKCKSESDKIIKFLTCGDYDPNITKYIVNLLEKPVENLVNLSFKNRLYYSKGELEAIRNSYNRIFVPQLKPVTNSYSVQQSVLNYVLNEESYCPFLWLFLYGSLDSDYVVVVNSDTKNNSFEFKLLINNAVETSINLLEAWIAISSLSLPRIFLSGQRILRLIVNISTLPLHENSPNKSVNVRAKIAKLVLEILQKIDPNEIIELNILSILENFWGTCKKINPILNALKERSELFLSEKNINFNSPRKNYISSLKPPLESNCKMIKISAPHSNSKDKSVDIGKEKERRKRR